jgi:tetratricopeptide (TPR) repeat protein
LTAAAAPIALIGIGLLVYNYLRFDSPWEFGQRYQLAGIKVSAQRLFSPDYFGSNVRMYFFQPLRWTGDYPFVQGIKVPPVPPGHLGAEGAFGALTNLPFLWLVGATLLVWRERRAAASLRPLRGFLVAVALLFVMNAATLCLFAGACDRYQAEFLPALTLLAAIGLLALEHAAASPTRFRLVRGAAMALLLVSAVTNWLASYKSSPEAQTVAGNDLAGAGAHAAAMEKYRQALRTEPDYAYAHHGLAIALAAEGRLPEAIEHFRQAVRSKPDFAEAHNGLGVALLRQQQPAEAEREFEAALRAAPDFAEAHFDCAVALLQLQRSREAIPHLEETLRLKPGFPGARERLELARLQTQATPKN